MGPIFGVLTRVVGSSFGKKLLTATKGIGLYVATDFAANSVMNWFDSDKEAKLSGANPLSDQQKTKGVINLLRRAFYFARWFAREYPETATDMILRLIKRLVNTEASIMATREPRDYVAALLVAHDCLYNTNNGRNVPTLMSMDAFASTYTTYAFGEFLIEPGMLVDMGEVEASLLMYVNMQFHALATDPTGNNDDVAYKTTREKMCHVFMAKYSTAIEMFKGAGPRSVAEYANFDEYGMAFIETINRYREIPDQSVYGNASMGFGYDIFAGAPFLKVAKLITQNN